MPTISQLSESLKQIIRRTAGERIPAVLGNGAGTVNVPNRPGWCYARLDGQDMPVQAYNQVVAAIDDTPVWVMRDPTSDTGVLQVVGVRVVETQSGSTYGIPSHADTHRWMAANGGNDPVMVEMRQIMPLRITADGLTVNVYPGVIPNGDTWQSVGAQSLDLSGDVPTTAGNARFVLIYVDDAGTLTGLAGAESASPTWTDIPALPDGGIALAVVYLYEGQTAIRETRTATDIMDVRWPQKPPSSSGGSAVMGGVAERQATQAYTGFSAAAIQWDAEIRDDNGYIDIAANPTRCTAPADGWYQVGFGAYFDIIIGIVWADCHVNGARVARFGSVEMSVDDQPSVGGATALYLTAGDYVEVVITTSEDDDLLDARGWILQM